MAHASGKAVFQPKGSSRRCRVPCGSWSVSTAWPAWARASSSPFSPSTCTSCGGSASSDAGIAFAALPVGAMATGPVAGALADRLGPRYVIAGGGLLAAATAAMLPFVTVAWQAIAVALVMGAGMTCLESPVYTLLHLGRQATALGSVRARLRRHRAGLGSGRLRGRLRGQHPPRGHVPVGVLHRHRLLSGVRGGRRGDPPPPASTLDDAARRHDAQVAGPAATVRSWPTAACGASCR